MILSTKQINPHVIRCDRFNGYNFSSHTKLSSRICYDYEIEYYVEGDGGISIDGVYIEFKAGEVGIRKPGQVVYGVLPYDCYMVFIDMTGKRDYDATYLLGNPLQAQPSYENPLLDALPSKLVPTNPKLIQKLFYDLYTIRQSNQLDTIKINMLSLELLYELFSQSYGINYERTFTNKHVLQAVDYINRCFCDDINIMSLIDKSGLSKPYFHKCFKEYSGTTPYAMMTSLRIVKAQKLLCMTQNSIADIALSCGYSDNVYFSHIFKKSTGLTPTSYRHKYVYGIE